LGWSEAAKDLYLLRLYAHLLLGFPECRRERGGVRLVYPTTWKANTTADELKSMLNSLHDTEGVTAPHLARMCSQLSPHL